MQHLIPENLLLVLTDKSSYHNRYTFSPDDVEILSIEDA